MCGSERVAGGPCNSMRMYKDVPGNWDAWDVDSTYTAMPVALDRKAEVAVAAAGPLVAAVRVTRRLNDSTMTQEVRLRRGSRRVDFVTTIDWRERRHRGRQARRRRLRRCGRTFI